jgi:hypothetical protein
VSPHTCSCSIKSRAQIEAKKKEEVPYLWEERKDKEIRVNNIIFGKERRKERRIRLNASKDSGYRLDECGAS